MSTVEWFRGFELLIDPDATHLYALDFQPYVGTASVVTLTHVATGCTVSTALASANEGMMTVSDVTLNAKIVLTIALSNGEHEDFTIAVRAIDN